MVSCPGSAQTCLPSGAFHRPHHQIRPLNLPFPKDRQLGHSCYPPMRSVHPLCHEAREARGRVCLITLMWSTEQSFWAGWGKDESKGRRGGGGRCSCGRLGKWEHVAAGRGAKVQEPVGSGAQASRAQPGSRGLPLESQGTLLRLRRPGKCAPGGGDTGGQRWLGPARAGHAHPIPATSAP